MSTMPGATALKRMSSFAYSDARLRIAAFNPPFVIMATRSRYAGDRIIGQRCGYTHDAAAGLLCLHLFYCELRDVNEALEISRDKRAKVFRRVFRERLHHKNAGIRDHSIDRPKLLKREFRNFLRGFELTYVTVDQTRDGRKLKAPSISSRSVRFLPHCSRGPETLEQLPRRCLATLL